MSVAQFVKKTDNLYHSLSLFSRQESNNIFLVFLQKTSFDISCKLSPLETFCIESQRLFSVENRINIPKCHLL